MNNKGFSNFKIKKDIINALSKQGIKEPTTIQNKAIPQILNKKDILAQSETGTGKTLAFLIPIFNGIKPTTKAVQSLIITPTRELAIQITSEAEKLSANTDTKILSLYGGVDIGKQLKKLNRGIDIVIATPGRLMDHMEKGSIDISKLDFLVLDEADQMLYVGFKREIELILSKTNKNKQLLCFSATLDKKVKKLAYRYMKDPVEIKATSSQPPLQSINQKIILTTDRKKQPALLEEIDNTNPFLAIIFCRTKRRVDKLEEDMKIKGYNCIKLHGGMVQSHRKRAIKAFRDIEIQYLIATDVAARGLDITGVTHIYNYDVPEDAQTYIHRIGRTGRMGEDGEATTFVTEKNYEMIKEIEKLIGFKIKKIDY